MIDFLDENALMFDAARSGDVNTLRELCNLGCNVNIRNDHQQTPLHIAVINLKHDAINFLLNHGADRNAADINGYTPCSLAVAFDLSARLIIRTTILHAYASSLPASSNSSSSSALLDDEPVTYRKTDRSEGNGDRSDYKRHRR